MSGSTRNQSNHKLAGGSQLPVKISTDYQAGKRVEKDAAPGAKGKNVYFVSLGCPKNLVDSQVMLGLLKSDEYGVIQDPTDADVIVVNTCSFIESSKVESIDTILEMAEYKDSGKCQALVVAGCLPQRYKTQLLKEMPEVDLFIGTGEYQNIAKLVDWARKGELPERAYVNKPAFIHTEAHPRLQTGEFFSAYLKISEGCNRRCSFCIIPTLRGNTRSRTVESLVEEARSLASQGVKELNLVAQDLTEYGMEHRYQKMTLEKLLPELCKIDGIEWIRLFYAYPDQFSDELIDIMARESKIVKYLDMPIQHTNDRILKEMNRKFTKAEIFTFVEKLRAKMPEIVIRSSTIAGFPGETEEEFHELLADLRVLKFDHLGAFAYSKEEGTKAGVMTGQVPMRTRVRRQREIRKLHEQFSILRNKKLLGREFTVLVEGESEETELLLKGRHFGQAPDIDGQVLINDGVAAAGDLVRVRITEILPYDLVGEIVD
ncbi:MAG: 30S ribosomal protein S12 methylthiotransferase RimO [Deltaproteobacteria bacterium]|nr:30S ribosomal protein S12 methylthiotransferase RimO [Deltaproteobacteria bacterium]